MTHDRTPQVDVGSYLEADDRKTLLRFITCGSVDDGKSTLIGRLLYESKLIFDDQLAALEADSRRVGTQGGALDFALLVDGLAAEREQGITIDVAYRFFTTERRKFIVADTPGHEQYTRNMVTGASTADVAVILVDARKGVLTQTRRHTLHRLAARHQARRARRQQAGPGRLRPGGVRPHRGGLPRVRRQPRADRRPAIPISALRGDNVVEPGANMPWYDGPPLAAYLETVEVGQDAVSGPFRLPGAAGHPPRPRLPRLRGHHRRRDGAPRRRGAGAAVRGDRHGGADRHLGRRPALGRGRPVGDPDPRPGDRRQPR